MKFFCGLKLWRRFAVLIALYSLGFFVSGAWSFKTLHRVVELAQNTSSIDTLEDRILWDMVLLCAIFVLSLGIALKVASMIRDSIALPLTEAGSTARRIADGDFSARADELGDHEIAVLGGAMNRMAESLQSSHAALQEHAVALEHQATHDDLTGLPNRALLKDRLRQSLLYAKRHRRRLMLIFIDLDNFKLVNDSLGHDTGDDLLKNVAQRMLRCVRGSDTVVRLGGDEFVIMLLDQTEKPEAITGFLQKLRDTVGQPLHIGSHELQVTCSIGLATYPDNGEDVDTLLRNADAAMYRAKELGRNNFQFYTSELNAKARERFVLEEGLRNAIVRDEFLLHYQPQVDIPTGRILGVEALIRWQHPDLGMVSPLKFIPLAEESGLIVAIGDWVLNTACRQNKAWQDAGMAPIVMSVNVSARQIRERNWVSKVEQALRETGLDAACLELEITESAIMQDVHHAVEMMDKVQAMGVRLSIDDFGTGYSSLSALKSFPVARLKIDRSFVRDIPQNKDDEAIAMAVIALGHRLNLRVIAEGVETEEQLAFLRKNQCDELQGYYFSAPVPALEFEQLAAAHNEKMLPTATNEQENSERQ